jgi:hypothetical protein
MTTLPPAYELLLRRFVDKFKGLSGRSFFPETDPTAVEFAAGKDSEYGLMELWQPVRFKTEPTALEGIYTNLPGRLPKLLLNFRWAEVDLDLFTLMANPQGNDLTGWLEQVSYDRHLWKYLLPAGYIPFGKGPDLDYDRVASSSSHVEKTEAAVSQESTTRKFFVATESRSSLRSPQASARL